MKATLKNELLIPIMLRKESVQIIIPPLSEVLIEKSRYLLLTASRSPAREARWFFANVIETIDIVRDSKVGIYGDSFADVSTKSLSTDIPSIQFDNPLPTTMLVLLKGLCFDFVPAKTRKLISDGFNIGDVITLCTDNLILGNFLIDDIFIRRIHIGLY